MVVEEAGEVVRLCRRWPQEAYDRSARERADEVVTVAKQSMGKNPTARTATSVAAIVQCGRSLVSKALADAIPRRLRQLYVCEGADVTLRELETYSRPSVAVCFTERDVSEGVPRAPRVSVRIGKTTPAGVVVIRRATRVTVSFEEQHERRPWDGQVVKPGFIETPASVAVRELVAFPMLMSLNLDKDKQPKKGPSRLDARVLIHGPEGAGKSAAARLASLPDRQGLFAQYPKVRCEAIDMRQVSLDKRGWDMLGKLFRRAVDFASLDRLPRREGVKARRRDDEKMPYSVGLVIVDGLEHIAGDDDKRRAMCVRLWKLTERATAVQYEAGHVVVVATTRTLDDLDPGLLEAFEKVRIEVVPPDYDERLELASFFLQDDELASLVAKRMAGGVAADIERVVGEALRYARVRGVSQEAVELVRARFPDARAQAETVPEGEPGRVSAADIEAAAKKFKPKVLEGLSVEVPTTRWEDIGGQDDAKLELRKAVEWPIEKKAQFERFGIEPVRGVLMHGPPGCSKTMLARACATESNFAFISLSAADVYAPYLGQAEATVRRAFRAADAAAPAILFFDEIDALVTDRSVSDPKAAENRVLATFLTCLDGATAKKKKKQHVVTIGATNRPFALDAALLRPGRLEAHVYVPLPGKQDRVKILRIHLRGVDPSPDIDLDPIAAGTRGYSGADLRNLVAEATIARDERVYRLADRPPPPPPFEKRRRIPPIEEAVAVPLPDDDDADELHPELRPPAIAAREQPIDPALLQLQTVDMVAGLKNSRSTISLERARASLPANWWASNAKTA